MVNIRKASQGFQLRDRRQQQQRKKVDRETIALLSGGLCTGLCLVILWHSMGSMPDDSSSLLLRQSQQRDPHHPHLKVQAKALSESFNAIAQDVITTLECDGLFNQTLRQMNLVEIDDGFGVKSNRRLEELQHGDDGGIVGGKNSNNNIAAGAKGDDAVGDDTPQEEEKWGREAGGGGVADDWNGGMMRDDVPLDWEDGGGGWAEITGHHLFCLAAMEEVSPAIKKEVKCDATNDRRQTLLELWSAARAQMPGDLLKKVLKLVRENKEQDLLGTSYDLWAPSGDDGMQYMLNSLNSENDADNGGIHGLHESLGPDKLFVDVGSCLGLTALAVTTKYPGTKIVSIEPASPNWLLQEMNLRCNLDKPDFKKIKLVLAGVGPNTDEEDNMMAKLMWRPTATTSTRSWTPESEHQASDVELVVRLRKLRSILAEADVYGVPIDVLNIDCEGCEYNLIPALAPEEFDAIPTVMGGVHWGYIPIPKLPSSERGKTTHERLCSHENIAKETKECCAFPKLEVKSSVPGEVLVQEKNGFPPSSSTVSDVIQPGLCDDFSSWASEHSLNDIKDDWGWFQLTSQA